MSKVLVATVGVTDIQVAVSSNDSSTQVSGLGDATLRDLQNCLIRGAIPFKWSTDAARFPKSTAGKVWLRRDGKCAYAKTLDEAAIASEVLEELVLVPTKLAGVETLLQAPRKRPDVVILFNTARGNRSNEPVASGPLLARWFAQAFDLPLIDPFDGPISEGVVSVDYADQKVALDGVDGSAVNPLAVQRIDDALRQIDGNVTSVTFALNGGVPVYRDQIRANAMFRFPDASFHEASRESPEGIVSARTHSSTPADSMRMRQNIRSLIQRGDFNGAYAVANQLTNTAPIKRQRGPTDPAWPDSEHEWIRVVHDAHLLFDGRLPPDLSGHRNVIFSKISGEAIPKCILPAFRAEAALSAGRWPEAVLWTFAFRETALIDLIGRLGFVNEVDQLDRSLTIHPGANIPAALLSEYKRKDQSKRSEDCLRHLFSDRFQYFTGHQQDRVWSNQFEPEAGKAFRAYTQALEYRVRRGRRDIPLREIRNTIAHSSLPQDNMRWVAEGFEQAGLWNLNPAKDVYGANFLDGPLVRELSHLAGAPELRELYHSFVDGLIDTIMTHRYR